MGHLNPAAMLAAYCAAVLGLSAIGAADYGVWILETSAGIIGVAVLAATWRRFPFSGIIYLLVAVHFTILAVGGHYIYEQEPVFNWIKDAFHLQRNHYDRVGHFAQGFVPALIIREFLLRLTPLKRGKMLFFLVTSVCLALSAFWELLEWWSTVLLFGGKDNAWLGMQGDIWDTQWDMFLCLIGAVLSQVVLSRLHDRSMSKITVPSQP